MLSNNRSVSRSRARAATEVISQYMSPSRRKSAQQSRQQQQQQHEFLNGNGESGGSRNDYQHQPLKDANGTGAAALVNTPGTRKGGGRGERSSSTSDRRHRSGGFNEAIGIATTENLREQPDSQQQHHRRHRSIRNLMGDSTRSNNDNGDDKRSKENSITSEQENGNDRGRSGSRSRGLNLIERARSRTRSRSRSKSNIRSSTESKPMLVAVTSCRSDAYHQQKAPGSAAMLPRKAPSALKLFHELAVGVKDAYEALGATPTPPNLGGVGGETLIVEQTQSRQEAEGNRVLFEFMGNLDFLLALVDEVATDTATRGALKDDNKFKAIRDVIKKCNKILETMLVRRERKYTLFFRLVQTTEVNELSAMKKWNARVEKAVGAVTNLNDDSDGSEARGDTDDDNESGTMNGFSSSRSSSVSKSRGGGGVGGAPGSVISSVGNAVQSRGREIMPAAGKVRSRRATPTPRLRQKNAHQMNGNGQAGASSGSDAADDGFNATISSVGNSINLLQQPGMIDGPILNSAMAKANGSALNRPVNSGQQPSPANRAAQTLNYAKPVKAKDELVDVIRGLKIEKEMVKANGAVVQNELKPNWQPKADIPRTVPRLPSDYVHRHRLMKQIVNCLLGRANATGEDTERGTQTFITSVTSRHADKAGNGKTTLAVAAIQTVEVRERFPDGVAWIKLGRTPLTEKDIRGLYEEIYNQLTSPRDLHTTAKAKGGFSGNAGQQMGNDGYGQTDRANAADPAQGFIRSSLSDSISLSRRRFQGGELEGIREDLSRLFCRKKILLCLDDVWRAEDACWFLFNENRPVFGNESSTIQKREEVNPFQILLTTRFPSILGVGLAQEIFVRIFTEHEAIKLLLSSAGRRPYGGKNSLVFGEARLVVKGCGNSPLAIRLAGGMLRRQRRWTVTSPAWTALFSQCKMCLNEATQLRSFSKSFGRIIDFSFSTVDDVDERAALRKCFVVFAMIFHSNDMMRLGIGIAREVVLGLFAMILDTTVDRRPAINSAKPPLYPETILSTLETMNFIEKARPDLQNSSRDITGDEERSTSEFDNESGGSDGKAETLLSSNDDSRRRYLMHDSVVAIAEEMAARKTSSFSPPDTAVEESSLQQNFFSSPLRSAAKYFVQLAQKMDSKDCGMAEYQFHELIVASLSGGWSSMSRKPIIGSLGAQNCLGVGVDDYIAAHLPSHLVRAQALTNAGDLLMDKSFISRRISSMGPVEATRQQVADLVELRRAVSKNKGPNRDGGLSHYSPRTPMTPARVSSTTPHRARCSPRDDGGESNSSFESGKFDMGGVLREASRNTIDEVCRVESVQKTAESSISLNAAICVSIIGEGLLKCRHPRDAMLRLEEAVGMFKGILGQCDIDVGRSLSFVAKALVKLGESRVAVVKFGEAARMYEACHATHHFDALSNSQSMAALLADLGEFDKAEARYEEVIRIRRALHGSLNPSVARTLNDYAVVLAKHGKIEDAIQQYQEARSAFEGASASRSTFSFVEAGGEFGFIYDAALIDMNIASIKAKSGDLNGAIVSYENGIAKMRELDKCTRIDNAQDGRSRHIVTSLGKIGSLKLKQGDRAGALEAFESILKECSIANGSTNSVKAEAAKAHIKCATILRAMPAEDDSRHEASLSHLREALNTYTQLYGATHRDTQAVAASLREWQQERSATYDLEDD